VKTILYGILIAVTLLGCLLFGAYQAVAESSHEVPTVERIEQIEQNIAELSSRLDEIGARLPADDTAVDPDPAPVDPDPVVTPEPSGFLTGMNVSELNYNTRLPVMADLMLQASYRKTGDDRKGTYQFFTAFNGLPAEHRPQGDYTIEAPEGVEVSLDDVAGWTNPEGRWITGQTRIKIYGTLEDAKQVNIWLPGYGPGTAGGTPLFTSEYLALWDHFDTSRYLDWGKINNSEQVRWEDRIKPGDIREATDPVPYETQIDLANATQTTFYAQIPHLADDNYIEQLARLIDDRLEPNLKVYVEWSNEVWNFNFKQTGYVGELAKASGRNLSQEYGYRAAVATKVFEDSFRDPDRVTRVLAGMAAVPWRAEQAVIGWEQANAGPFEAIALAAYATEPLGSKSIDSADRLGWSAEDWLNHAIASLQDHQANWYGQHGALADKYGVPMIAYEGGQHFASASDKWKAFRGVFTEMQDHPLMADLLIADRELFKSSGGSSIIYFNMASPQDIAWPFGTIDNINDLEGNPKWQAIVSPIE